jgi:hypothetical protein
VAAHGPTVRENLPYPIVHYPHSEGVFFGFSPEKASPAVLCTCAKPAVEHAVRLRRMEYALDGAASLDLSLFPGRIVEQVERAAGDPLSALRFERKLCHRCNLAAPTLRYCHEMEGGRFIQYYGWYVGQAYLRFGIQLGALQHLPDVCPEVLEPYVAAVEMAGRSLRQVEEASALSADHSDPFLVAQQQFATQMYRRACRSLDKQIENLVREEFGFKPVGEEWISESMLYRIVCQVFPEQQALRRHRPEWLGGLELDVYLPELDLAFEYQGQQHFHSISAWGGEEALGKVAGKGAGARRAQGEALRRAGGDADRDRLYGAVDRDVRARSAGGARAMPMITRTPRHKIWIVVYALAVLGLVPMVTRVNVTINYYRGVYPPSDAITIPILESRALALLGVPYLALLLLLGLPRYQAGVSLLRFRRSLWELVAILLVSPGLIVGGIWFLYWLDVDHLPIALVYLLLLHLMLLVRTMISNKRPEPDRFADDGGGAWSQDTEETPGPAGARYPEG